VGSLILSLRNGEGVGICFVEMIDTIKKAILAGVGAAAITKDKAEKALNELVDKGKLSATDAKEAANKIADEGKQEFEAATTSLQAKFDDLLAKAGRGQKERIDALEARVAELEAQLKEPAE
tara:strand:+ start:805 stop:1170 length:366 start_codon:yes stop_codon:yes gene_type:complete